MIKLNNLKFSIGYTKSDITERIAKKLRIDANKIVDITILKRSLDARKKDDIKYVLTLGVEVVADEQKIIRKFKPNEASIYKDERYEFITNIKTDKKTVVIGSGPAGLFCAYTLIKAGIKPLIIERGEKVEDRIKSVDTFFEKGVLNPESNIQFGEGGAGTFSDGKLNTGISDIRIKEVLKTFVSFGAPEEILYEQKPHIGTDKLREVIVNFRKYIEQNGGEFRFSTKLADINIENDKVISIELESNGLRETLECDNLILAIGHSARDTFYMLKDKDIQMQQKPFAIGVRIEHKQELINIIQYGKEYNNKDLPVADYKTAVHLDNGRSVYSFCMCPGGFVVAAASEQNMIAVNGMSNYLRDNTNANSALLVNVRPEDLGSTNVLAGIEFQRDIEKRAYNISNSYKAPAQTLGSFLYNLPNKIGEVSPSYKPDVTYCNLSEVLPEFVTNSLKQGILLIDKKMQGYADNDALLTGPETRSSSPVRILRDEFGVSNIKGIFPCGEGAGYAGGITSAAVDGIKTAENIIKSLE